MRKRAASRAKSVQPPPPTTSVPAVSVAISPNLDALLRFDDSVRRGGVRPRPQTGPCGIEAEDVWRQSRPSPPSPISGPPLAPWEGPGGLSPPSRDAWRGGISATGGGLPPPPRGPRRARSRTVGQKLSVASNAREGASTMRAARSNAHLREQSLYQHQYGEGERAEEREGQEVENPYINRAPALPPFVAEVWRAAVLTGSAPASAGAVGEVEAEARASQGGSLDVEVKTRDGTVVAREAMRSREAVLSREASRSRKAQSREASRPRDASSRETHWSNGDADGRTSIDTVTSPSSSVHASSRPGSPKKGETKDGKGGSPCRRARPLQKLFAKVHLPSVHQRHKRHAHAHDDKSEVMQALGTEPGRRDASGSGTTSAASSQRGHE